MPTIWTEARKERLKELWTCTRLTAPLIAIDLGGFEGYADGGRSAVIGAAHRFDLPPRAKRDSDPDIEEKRAAARRERDRVRHRNRRAAEPQAVVFRPKVHNKPKPAPVFSGSLDIPYGDLWMFSHSEPNECRFIDPSQENAPFFACGSETEPGASYCPHCHDIVYRKRESAGLAPMREAA